MLELSGLSNGDHPLVYFLNCLFACFLKKLKLILPQNPIDNLQWKCKNVLDVQLDPSIYKLFCITTRFHCMYTRMKGLISIFALNSVGSRNHNSLVLVYKKERKLATDQTPNWDFPDLYGNVDLPSVNRKRFPLTLVEIVSTWTNIYCYTFAVMISFTTCATRLI